MVSQDSYSAQSPGDAASGQVALLHFVSGQVQVPRAIQIPHLATLAGALIFLTDIAVVDFLCAVHCDELPSIAHLTKWFWSHSFFQNRILVRVFIPGRTVGIGHKGNKFQEQTLPAHP